MKPEKFEELIGKAKQYNDFSIEFAENKLYASRDIGVTITDIKNALTVARTQPKEYTFKELMYKLANSAEFQKLEYELRQKALDIIDHQIAFAKRYSLDIKQNNEIFDALVTFLKENLFTAEKLRQKY